MGPNQFIQELRLHQSLKDIKKNNKTVVEIACDIGFNSHTYFTRVFKKKKVWNTTNLFRKEFLKTEYFP
jgi:AraC-like DNA-binding protein